VIRCEWGGNDPLMVAYHDEEWGVPARHDLRLFEFLTLEGAQAGLSWSTILHRREGYRRAFAGFDPDAVAAFDEADVGRLLADAAIIRNRAKIESTIKNAQALVGVRQEVGSFATYLWAFVEGRPLQPGRRSLGEVPAETPLARTVSKDLRRRGFSFVGPTIVYSLLQACGLVNDHVVTCFRWPELANA
jgi:DNA-3-methyladenine glycosylase I